MRKGLDTSETIYAMATGSLPSAIAIERVSGPKALEFANRLFRSRTKGPLESRGLYYGDIQDSNGKRIDSGVVLVFPGPNSVTGENLVEFHCHGSEAILMRLEESLAQLGARPAEKGEFSYRGFLAGKLKAEELDNLGDLFLAQDPDQLDRIYAREEGSMASQLGGLRGRLIEVQAILDTAVDFVEEYASVTQGAIAALKLAIHDCSRLSERYLSFQKGANSPKIVLVGAPNAGKSSLFNALLRRYRAIVHEQPGTTRDAVTESVRIGGKTWELVDTAGLREAQTATEGEGIGFSEEYLKRASYWVLVVDGTGSSGLGPLERSLLEKYVSTPHQILWNKVDLSEWVEPQLGGQATVSAISAKNGNGLAEFLQQLTQNLEELRQKETEPLPRASQAVSLKKMVGQLEELLVEVQKEQLPPELLAEKNRMILRTLEPVLDEVSPEQVLDRVFSEFCIGK